MAKTKGLYFKKAVRFVLVRGKAFLGDECFLGKRLCV